MGAKGSNFAPNTQFFWQRAKGLAPGVYREVASVAGLSDLNFQWHSYGAGSASFVFYATNLTEERDIAETDPALAPAVWRDETPSGAQFPSSPVGVPGTDRVDVVAPGWANVMIEMTVTVTLDDFSLSVRGQGRSG